MSWKFYDTKHKLEYYKSDGHLFLNMRKPSHPGNFSTVTSNSKQDPSSGASTFALLGPHFCIALIQSDQSSAPMNPFRSMLQPESEQAPLQAPIKLALTLILQNGRESCYINISNIQKYINSIHYFKQLSYLRTNINGQSLEL